MLEQAIAVILASLIFGVIVSAIISVICIDHKVGKLYDKQCEVASLLHSIKDTIEEESRHRKQKEREGR